MTCLCFLCCLLFESDSDSRFARLHPVWSIKHVHLAALQVVACTDNQRLAGHKALVALLEPSERLISSDRVGPGSLLAAASCRQEGTEAEISHGKTSMGESL